MGDAEALPIFRQANGHLLQSTSMIMETVRPMLP
jgi:hypothetical protein